MTRADEVVLHLKNGDRLSGSLISESPNDVTITSGALGKLTIPRSEIERRDSKTPPPAPSSPPAANLAASPASPGGSTNIASGPKASATPASAAAPPPAVKKPAPPARPKAWNTDIQVGLNLRYGAKDQQDYYGTLKTTYAHDRFRGALDYSFTRGRTEGILSANRMGGSIKPEYDITKRTYAYSLFGAGYDEVRKIDFQYDLGPGMGMQVLTRTNLSLKVELGFNYQEQYRSDQTDDKTYSARIAEIVSWKLWDKLIVDAKCELFPNLESPSDYRIRVESTVRYPFLKNMSLNLVVIDLYDTLPPRGVSNNDLQIRSTVGLKF